MQSGTTATFAAVPTATTERCDFELSEVEAAVGPRAFDRGRAYARRGRLLELDWDPDGQTLTGSGGSGRDRSPVLGMNRGWQPTS